MEPVLEELARTHSDRVIVRRIHVDEDPETTEKYSVTSVATSILLTPRGEEYHRAYGFFTVEEILELLEELKEDTAKRGGTND